MPDSKTPNGIAEVPLTPWAVQGFRNRLATSGPGPFLFPSDLNPSGHQRNLSTAWQKSLRRAGVPYFRIHDLRSTYATRLSAGGVAVGDPTASTGRLAHLQKAFADEAADEARGSGKNQLQGERDATAPRDGFRDSHDSVKERRHGKEFWHRFGIVRDQMAGFRE